MENYENKILKLELEKRDLQRSLDEQEEIIIRQYHEIDKLRLEVYRLQRLLTQTISQDNNNIYYKDG